MEGELWENFDQNSGQTHWNTHTHSKQTWSRKHIKHTSATTRGKTKDQQRYAKFSQTCQTAELFTHLTSKNVVFKEDQINNTKRDVLSVLSGWIQMAISPLIKNIPSSGHVAYTSKWPTSPPQSTLQQHGGGGRDTTRAREKEEGCGGGDPEMWWERKEGGGGGNSHVTGTSWSVDGKRETHNLKGMIDTDTGLLSERTGPLEPCSHSYIYHRAGQLQHCRVTFLSWL